MAKDPEQATLPTHGASVLPSVQVDSYNLEVEDEDGFIGDSASKRAFRDLLDKWRARLREVGEDSFGEKPTDEISKKKLDMALVDGTRKRPAWCRARSRSSRRARQGDRRFLKVKEWRATSRIVVGGGFRASRVGELAMGWSRGDREGRRRRHQHRSDPP